MNQFAIGFYAVLGTGEATYYYGRVDEVEKIFEKLWKKGSDWRNVITVNYFKSLERMNEELNYNRERWENVRDGNAEFVNVDVVRNVSSEEIA